MDHRRTATGPETDKDGNLPPPVKPSASNGHQFVKPPTRFHRPRCTRSLQKTLQFMQVARGMLEHVIPFTIQEMGCGCRESSKTRRHGWRTAPEKPSSRDPETRDDRQAGGPRQEETSSRMRPLLCGVCGKDLRPQSGWRTDGAERRCDAFVDSALLNPCGQSVRMFPQNFQGNRKLGAWRVQIGGGGRAGDQPCFVEVHGRRKIRVHAVGPFRCRRLSGGMGTIWASGTPLIITSWRRCRSRSLPRERRDITVPIGMSRVSAISR